MSVLAAIRKLRGRSFAELRERLAQRAASLAERAGWRDAGEPSNATFRRRLSTALGSDGDDEQAVLRAVHSLRHGARPALVPGLDALPDTLALIRSRWPASVADVTRAADEILDGTIPLLGFTPLRLGDPVEWFRDHMRGVSAPVEHWSQIDYLDPAVAGDHKLVWELNRHQWMVTLGMAYALTGRDAYAARAAELLEHWLDCNPPKRGVNWASSLEVAYRAIAWIWALRLMGRAPAFTDALVARWLKAFEVSGRHLERYLSTWFSPNTHLTGEALGLLYLGTELPELDGAQRWRDRGWSILLQESARQVRPDGTYFEQATYYHRYTLDIFMHARILGSTRPPAEVERFDEVLRKLAHFVAWTSRADGTIPLFGDEDGGRLLFLDRRPNDDARSPVAVVAAITGDPILAFAGDPPTEELAWLLGRAGVQRLSQTPASPPADAARDFDDGGFYVMRDDWSADSAVLTVDCGPLGVANGGHAHADTLAFDLAIGASPVFVDAGTVSYTTSARERDLMRSSTVHNTVSLHGESSSVSAGPFRWSQMTDGVLDAWHATAAGALFEGHHDGFCRLSPPARHRRTILQARHAWWIVRDVVEVADASRSGHTAMSTFQCAPGLDITVRDSELEVSDDGRLLLTVQAYGSDGRWEVDDAVASRCYGSRESARRARYCFSTGERSAVTFVMVRGAGPAWQVTHERLADGEAVRFAGSEVDDLVLFDVREAVDGVRTDARVAWVRRRASTSTANSLLVSGGTVVELEGSRVADGHGGVISAVREDAGWRVNRSAVRDAGARRVGAQN